MVTRQFYRYKPLWLQLFIFGLITMGSFVLLSLLSAVVLAFSHAPLPGQDNSLAQFSNNATRWLQVISSVFLFLVPAFAFAFFADPKPLNFLGFRRVKQPLYFGLSITIMLLAVPIVGLLGQWNQQAHLPGFLSGVEKWIRSTEAATEQLEKQILVMHTIGDLVFNLFVMAIVPAVAEELFFRAVLQRFFIGLTKDPWKGIVIAAIVFSFMHFEFLGFVPRVLLGILLGALYWYSGSLWPAIIGHFVNNGLMVVMYYLQQNNLIRDKFFDDSASVPVQQGLISLVLVALGIYWVVKLSKTRYADEYATAPQAH